MHCYLDFNASSPLRVEAQAAWMACQEQHFGNPNSTHYYGQQSRALFDDARNKIGDLLGCKGHELVLCGSGTEANALAIYAARQLGATGRILCTAIDHSSVIRNAQMHAQTELIDVDANGLINKEDLLEKLKSPCDLVAFQFANNEIGTIQAVEELVASIHERSPGTRILLDACQGAGKHPLNFRQLDVDFATVAGHKFGAPKGCGLLYTKLGTKVEALIHGGRQQQDRRSGTEDVAAIAAMHAALSASYQEYEQEAPRQQSLIDETWQTIKTALPDAVWIAQAAPRLSNTISLAHPGVKNSALIPRLDLAGYCVSPGSACMAARGEPSHVVAALGIEGALAHSVIRVSIGATTRAEQMQGFSQAYIKEVRDLL